MGTWRFMALCRGLSPSSGWAAAVAKPAKPAPLEGDAAVAYFDSI